MFAGNPVRIRTVEPNAGRVERSMDKSLMYNLSLSLYKNKEYQMNTLNMKGNWKEIAGKLKQQFANLTDDDLLFKEGKEEELLGRLQQKLGKTKEEVRRMIAKI
jgi:uncharacterized protein YjbJ (UPF0337 family)